MMMTDDAWRLLQLTTLTPNQAAWPKNYEHWTAIHGAADFVRRTLGEALDDLDKLDKNRDLTAKAKAEKRGEIVAKAMHDLTDNPVLDKARSGVETMTARWDAKIAEATPVPSHAAEIRAHVKDLEGHKLDWINAADAESIGAVLEVQPYLSGMTDAEVSAARMRAESFADPEIVSARNTTSKAMAEVERAFVAARHRLSERVRDQARAA